MKTINFIKSTLGLSLLMATVSMVAQQDPNRTFYRYNMNLINPAYAGSNSTDSDSFNDKVFDANPELGINFRSQWVGVEGAPESQTAFFSTGLGSNLGLGVSILNDRTFVERQTAITVDISYRLKVSDNTDLFLGVKAGGNSYNVNTDGLTTFGFGQDPSLNDIEGRFNPGVGAGALLKGRSYFLAFSIPNVISTERLEQNDGTVRLGDSRAHMYLTAGYDIAFSPGLTFKPSAMLRHVEATPLSVDVTAAFNFHERMELGASYRFNEGIGGLLLFNAADWIDLGYAYEAPFDSPVQAAGNGTHEVFIKFKM